MAGKSCGTVLSLTLMYGTLYILLACCLPLEWKRLITSFSNNKQLIQTIVFSNGRVMKCLVTSDTEWRCWFIRQTCRFILFFLCLAAVSQHAVCSSELHHGEGGEHPAVQPLAPTHPHLTPDPTGPESDPGPGADLHPDRNSWTEIQNAALDWTDTPLCQDYRVQTKLRTDEDDGRRHETKRQNNGSRIGFDFIWYVCIFWVFNHLKLFFCCTKRGDQLPSLKNVRRQKNTIKDFLCIAARRLLPAILIQFHCLDQSEVWTQPSFSTLKVDVEAAAW